MDARALTTDREQIDYLEAENARLRDILRGLTGAGKDQPVPGLTLSQSRLVRALESAGGRVVTRDALFDALYWDRGGDYPADQKIVLVMICQIRRRRPDIGKRIVTAWGQGYALLPEAGS